MSSLHTLLRSSSFLPNTSQSLNLQGLAHFPFFFPEGPPAFLCCLHFLLLSSHTRAEFALSQETGTCKELQEPWAGAAGTLSWSFRYHLWRTSNCQESFCQLLMILCVKILCGIHRDSPQALLYISYFLFDGQRHSISPSPKQIMAYRNTLRRCWWQHGHSPLQTNSHETDLFSAAHWAERVVGSTFPITPT